MGYQTVRALVVVSHDGVNRKPGVTSGKFSQDFVVSDALAEKLISKGFVTSLGVAAEPRVVLPVEMEAGKDTRSNPVVTGAGVGAVARTSASSANSTRAYLAYSFSCRQLGNATVLPKDYSLNGVVPSYGASTTDPLDGSYLDINKAGQGDYLAIPNAAFRLAPLTDSFAGAFTIKGSPNAGTGADTILGCSDLAGMVGFNMLVYQSGNANANKLGARIYGAGVAQNSGTASASSVKTGADVRVYYDFNAKTGIFRVKVNNALEQTSAALTFNAADVFTGDMRYGMAYGGSASLNKFRDIKFAVFKGSGLPANIDQISTADNSDPITGFDNALAFL